MVELERRAFYLVPEKTEHRVVQLLEIGDHHLVVEEAETRKRWTINRAPFEERLADGRVVQVTPRWEPAGQEVTV